MSSAPSITSCLSNAQLALVIGNILVTSLFLSSCTTGTTNDDRLHEVYADFAEQLSDSMPKGEGLKVWPGMVMNNLKDKYRTASYSEVPVFEYGIDGEENGVLLEQEGLPLFFTYTREGTDTIAGVCVLSPGIWVGPVHVGMTVKEFMAIYPQARLAIDVLDEGVEYCIVEGAGLRAEFLTTDSTRVGQYDHSQPEPEFIRVLRPEARIDRIAI